MSVRWCWPLTGKKINLRSFPSGLRVMIFLLCLLGLWGPGALLIHRVLGGRLGRPDVATAIALILLYGLFVFLVRRWGRRVHRWPRPLRHLGLVGGWRQFLNRLLRAGLLGLGGVVLLFGLQLLLGWAVPQWPALGWPLLRLLAEASLVGLAYGLLEELLFRGWLLAELEAGGSRRTALVANALIFALAHFIKPWAEILRTFPQFLGLLILGLALVWARRAAPVSLALPIGLHGGLVGGYYLFNVGDWVTHTGLAPDWVTGIDRNPLAGLLGVGLLSAIALYFARQAQANASGPPR